MVLQSPKKRRMEMEYIHPKDKNEPQGYYSSKMDGILSSTHTPSCMCYNSSEIIQYTNNGCCTLYISRWPDSFVVGTITENERLTRANKDLLKQIHELEREKEWRELSETG